MKTEQLFWLHNHPQVMLVILFAQTGSKELSSREQTEQFFSEYQAEYEAAAAQVLEQGSTEGVELPPGVQNIYLSSDCYGSYIEFYTGGSGFGPHTWCWGVFYNLGEEPADFAERNYIWDGVGWERNSDPWEYIKPLGGQWYAYEIHY